MANKKELLPEIGWAEVASSAAAGVPWATTNEMKRYLNLFFYELAGRLACGIRVKLPLIGSLYILPRKAIKNNKIAKRSIRLQGIWNRTWTLRKMSNKHYGSLFTDEYDDTTVEKDYYPARGLQNGKRKKKSYLELPEIDLTDLLWEE